MKNLTPTKLRSGDEVIVVAGKDIGKKGTLREIIKSKNRAIVTGINMMKKHTIYLGIQKIMKFSYLL